MMDKNRRTATICKFCKSVSIGAAWPPADSAECQVSKKQDASTQVNAPPKW